MYKIITKDQCIWCTKAKKILRNNNISFEEVSIPESLSAEDFYTLIEKYEDTPKTVPKIFDDDGELIGGYNDLMKKMEEEKLQMVD